jgi:hypothetical protein
MIDFTSFISSSSGKKLVAVSLLVGGALCYDLLNQEIHESTFSLGLPKTVNQFENSTEILTLQGSFIVDSQVSVSNEIPLDLKFRVITSPLHLSNVTYHLICQGDKCIKIDGRLLPGDSKTSLPSAVELSSALIQ